MKDEFIFNVKIERELLDWYSKTLPGLSRAWLVNRMLERFREKFMADPKHYVELVDDTVTDVYNDMKEE